jgi:hypothetical protein
MPVVAVGGPGPPHGGRPGGGRHAEIAKRIDIAATAIFHGMTVAGLSDLDLFYTPPLGSPGDAVQIGAQAWTRTARRHEPAAQRLSCMNRALLACEYAA